MMRKLFLNLIMCLAGGVLFYLASPAEAQAATLYLDPASASVTNGANFSVRVRVNSGGEEVNGVMANLSYPQSQLEFVSVSGSGSAFNVEAPSSGGNGSISISRGSVTPQSGSNLLVATITFKARVGSGSAQVSFDEGNSAVVRASDNQDILNGTSGGTYSFTGSTPPPSPPPSPPPPSAEPPDDDGGGTSSPPPGGGASSPGGDNDSGSQSPPAEDDPSAAPDDPVADEEDNTAVPDESPSADGTQTDTAPSQEEADTASSAGLYAGLGLAVLALTAGGLMLHPPTRRKLLAWASSLRSRAQPHPAQSATPPPPPWPSTPPSQSPPLPPPGPARKSPDAPRPDAPRPETVIYPDSWPKPPQS